MGGTFSASSGSLGGLESAFGKPEAEEKIGTGYGEKLAMNTRKVTFNRLTETPFETLALRYESRATLIKLGVISEVAKPNPFPADVGVKTPPGWKG